jgi:NTE family protein
VEWNGNTYVDGGILNNLPVEPLDPFYEIIIGSHTNPIVDNFIPKNARQVMERSLMMAITCNVENRLHRCTHLIEPHDLGRYKVMDLSVADKIYALGYETALTYLDLNWGADQ